MRLVMVISPILSVFMTGSVRRSAPLLRERG
jgi:hypothetical protein